MEISQVFDCGESVAKCGYCDSEDTWHTHGVWAYSLTNQDYQDLIDRGWRRSGQYLYKPDLQVSCCASYTIRLDVHKFKPTKSQKRTRARFNKFITGQWSPSEHRATAAPRARKEALVEQVDHATKSTGDLDTTQKKRVYTMNIVQAEFRDEAFQVYRRYQKIVHCDKEEELSEKGYTRFLCAPPLPDRAVRRTAPTTTTTAPTTSAESASETPAMRVNSLRLGGFHMEHRIDGRLFMVGVVDILPSCLSSVYLFYDPDFAFLSPGVVAALLEIEWVQQAALLLPSLHYYYMGYYIHTCPKMLYKGAYEPSDLLCPETFQWVEMKEALPVIAEKRYARLAKDGSVCYVDMMCVQLRVIVPPYDMTFAFTLPCDSSVTMTDICQNACYVEHTLCWRILL
eukprot:TRINITY_DN2977_c0_g1_i2.p1 TRINITY_DN2977_c0_g1~~TRINITY_DN2977_c0_g1_i2.p1  ORF type:complete len:398 (+),score=35.95 TRINITY_DN2977_c0_g1_i2:55-1248(+)